MALDSDLSASELMGGRFQVERLIGQGGTGQVFAARHVITGRQVALKVVPPARRKPSSAGRFLREARVASALRHPNIVEVFDAFEEPGGSAVLVMELLVGETLSAHLARVGTLSLTRASEILVPVARALLAAHRVGVVHRDLKPDNIFLAARGGAAPMPKVLDFGIAKVQEGTELAEGLSGPTNTGAIVGTPHYMAFEQAMSEKDIDGRADVWSLGVILFEALAGRRPLEFDTFGQMYKAFFEPGSMLSPRKALPALPSEVIVLLEQCLIVERGARLGSLADFIETLGPYEVSSDGAIGELGSRTPSTRPIRAWSLGAAAVLGTGLAVVAAAAGRHHASPVVPPAALGSALSDPPPSGAAVSDSASSEAPPGAARTPSALSTTAFDPTVGGSEAVAPLPGPPGRAAATRDETPYARAPLQVATGLVPTAAPAATARGEPAASSAPVATKRGILETPPY